MLNLVTNESGFSDKYENVVSSAIDPTSGNIMAVEGDYSELEFLLNVLNNSNSIFAEISINNRLKAEPGMVTDVVYGRAIRRTHPVDKYYVPFINNNWNPDDIAYGYREYAIKTRLIPEKLFNLIKYSEPFEITFIKLGELARKRLMKTFYELHQNGYNFTRFAKATNNPLSELFLPLLRYSGVIFNR